MSAAMADKKMYDLQEQNGGAICCCNSETQLAPHFAAIEKYPLQCATSVRYLSMNAHRQASCIFIFYMCKGKAVMYAHVRTKKKKKCLVV